MTVQDWSNAMDIKELQNIIQENGVVGAGGAGFPTYMKLTDKANTILMNCAECEPLLKLHRQLLEKHAYEIMKTFHMVQETVGASEAIIGIKKSYVQMLRKILPQMRVARYLHKDGKYRRRNSYGKTQSPDGALLLPM